MSPLFILVITAANKILDELMETFKSWAKWQLCFQVDSDLWPWAVTVWPTDRVLSYMTIKGRSHKWAFPGVHSQATCWKGNCTLLSSGWIQWVEGLGQEGLERCMVNPHFLVGIYQLKLFQILTRTSQNFASMDMFRYKNYIIITTFSLFRWQRSSKALLFSRRRLMLGA